MHWCASLHFLALRPHDCCVESVDKADSAKCNARLLLASRLTVFCRSGHPTSSPSVWSVSAVPMPCCALTAASRCELLSACMALGSAALRPSLSSSSTAAGAPVRPGRSQVDAFSLDRERNKLPNGPLGRCVDPWRRRLPVGPVSGGGVVWRAVLRPVSKARGVVGAASLSSFRMFSESAGLETGRRRALTLRYSSAALSLTTDDRRRRLPACGTHLSTANRQI